MSKLAQRTCAAALVLIVAACGGGDEPVDTTVTEPAVEAQIAITMEPWPNEHYVIRSRAEWVTAWDERYRVNPCMWLGANSSCLRRPMPEFDFDRFTLVGIYRNLSPRETLNLDGVQAIDGRIHVRTKLRTQDGIGAAINYDRSVFVLIPRTDLPVVWDSV